MLLCRAGHTRHIARGWLSHTHPPLPSPPGGAVGCSALLQPAGSSPVQCPLRLPQPRGGLSQVPPPLAGGEPAQPWQLVALTGGGGVAESQAAQHLGLHGLLPGPPGLPVPDQPLYPMPPLAISGCVCRQPGSWQPPFGTCPGEMFGILLAPGAWRWSRAGRGLRCQRGSPGTPSASSTSGPLQALPLPSPAGCLRRAPLLGPGHQQQAQCL